MRLLFILFSMLLYSFIWSQDVVEKEVSVTVDDDGQKERKVKIIVKTDDGEEKILEWLDDGEMPDEIAKQLEEIDSEGIISLDFHGDDMDGDDSQIIVMRGNDGRRPRRIKRMKRHRGKAHRDGPRFWNDLDRGQRDVDLSDAYIGAQIRSMDDGGVEVLELIKDGPADNAKLEKGDVIQRINGARTRTMEGMLQLLNYYEPNDQIEMIISRDGKEEKVKMTLGRRPDYYKM